MRTLIFWAGGFRDYASDRDAIAALGSRWFPMSKDFNKTASFTSFTKSIGITRSATTANHFISQLRKFKVGKLTRNTISRIVFIGHGDGVSLGFGGHVHSSTKKRTYPVCRITNWLDATYLLTVNTAHRQQIRDRLTANARIDIVACVPKNRIAKAGVFNQVLANFFDATVHGFDKELEWELYHRTGAKVLRRGGIYDPRPKGAIPMRRVIKGTHLLTFPTSSRPTQRLHLRHRQHLSLCR